MSKKRKQKSKEQKNHDPRGIQWDNQHDEYSKKPVTKNFHLQPKNEKQEELIQAINHKEIIIAEAPAGCGKTFIAGNMATKFLSDGTVKKIILTRANVHVGKSIGMLPGTVNEKMEPLLAPILNVLRERMGDGVYSYNRSSNKIEVQALEYVRGLSLRGFIVVDEAQNLTKEEIIAMVTRFESGRILFLGDPRQTDIRGQNGLSWLIEFSKKHNLNVGHVEFGLDCIVRSDFVKTFLIALYTEESD